MTGGDSPIADPDGRRRIDAMRTEPEIVVLSEAGEVRVDERGAHVQRRRLLILEMRHDPVEELVHLGALTGEVQLGEIVVIEESSGDLGAAERRGDCLAVVEGADVGHRILVGSKSSARDSPLRDEPSKHAGRRDGEQFVQRQAVRPTATDFTYWFGNVHHSCGCR